jgi:hypothetical protein
MTRLGVGALWLACVLGGAACTTDSNLGLLILRNKAADPAADCILDDSEDGLFLASGTLNVADPGTGYQFHGLVLNGLQTSMAGGQPNRNIVVLQGADVEIMASNSPASQAAVAALAGDVGRSQFFGESIRPGDTSLASYLLLDAGQEAALRSVIGTDFVQIIARTRVFGEANGSEIASPWFDYPVTLCTGMLCADDFCVPAAE